MDDQDKLQGNDFLAAETSVDESSEVKGEENGITRVDDAIRDEAMGATKELLTNE